VAGKNRVPRPDTGNTAFRIALVILPFSQAVFPAGGKPSAAKIINPHPPTYALPAIRHSMLDGGGFDRKSNALIRSPRIIVDSQEPIDASGCPSGQSTR